MAISFTSKISFDLKNRLLVKSWIKQVIEKEGKKIGDISYVFCDDEQELEINKQFLNHNFFTDIITFDYVEKNVISGDIFISLDRVKENSKIFETDFNNELFRVIIHGILHLLGYEDKTLEEKNLMREKENECLKMINEK